MENDEQIVQTKKKKKREKKQKSSRLDEPTQYI